VQGTIGFAVNELAGVFIDHIGLRKLPCYSEPTASDEIIFLP